MSAQIAVLRNAQNLAARVEQGVEGAVDDALRPNVHPAAGSHLAVAGNAHCGGLGPVVRIVEHTDHQAVGDNHAGAGLMGLKQTHRVAGHHDKRLFVSQRFQIFFDQLILHPVLADLAGLAVGNQLVGVQGHFVVQVVIDHDLERLAFYTVALVLVDGLAVDAILRHEAIAVDAAPCHQLLQELRSKLLVKLFRNITQRVFQSELDLSFVQGQLTLRCAANTLFEGGIFRQNGVEFDCHSITDLNIVHVVEPPLQIHSSTALSK